MSETLDLKILPKCVVVLMKSAPIDNETYDKVKKELSKHSNLKIKEHKEEKHEAMFQKYYVRMPFVLGRIYFFQKELLGFIVVVKKNEVEIYYNKMIARATPVLLTLAANWYVSNEQKYVSKVEWVTSATEEAQVSVLD